MNNLFKKKWKLKNDNFGTYTIHTFACKTMTVYRVIVFYFLLFFCTFLMESSRWISLKEKNTFQHYLYYLPKNKEKKWKRKQRLYIKCVYTHVDRVSKKEKYKKEKKIEVCTTTFQCFFIKINSPPRTISTSTNSLQTAVPSDFT